MTAFFVFQTIYARVQAVFGFCGFKHGKTRSTQIKSLRVSYGFLDLWSIWSVSRLDLGIVAFNAAADASASAGRSWRLALQLLRQAAQWGLQQTQVTGGTALKAFGAADGSEWPQMLWQLEALRHLSLTVGIREANVALMGLGDTWNWSLCILDGAMERGLEPTEFTGSVLVNKLKQNLGTTMHNPRFFWGVTCAKTLKENWKTKSIQKCLECPAE